MLGPVLVLARRQQTTRPCPSLDVGKRNLSASMDGTARVWDAQTSTGGADDPGNLLYCCQRCKLYKADYWPLQQNDPVLWNPRRTRPGLNSSSWRMDLSIRLPQ